MLVFVFGGFFFLSFRLMIPSTAHNLSSLPLSHDWTGCFSCKEAVMMIAFVKEGVELATNVLVAIYVFWKS